MQAIDNHNLNLPPKKKAKDSIGEFSAVNVHAKYMVFRNQAKKESSYIVQYNNIGLIDDCNNLGSGPHADQFSLTNKAREL